VFVAWRSSPAYTVIGHLLEKISSSFHHSTTDYGEVPFDDSTGCRLPKDRKYGDALIR